ncbi:hypothetical protein FRC19_000884 [Serendipita sp. 401]|nr:hypothetical protein FRC19_000884 [Serendipita sp. 401]
MSGRGPSGQSPGGFVAPLQVDLQIPVTLHCQPHSVPKQGRHLESEAPTRHSILKVCKELWGETE